MPLNVRQVIEAARYGHLGQIAHLLTPDQLRVEYREDGRTPVHYAADYGQLDRIAHLLTPAMLTAKDRCGWTPVHAAAYYGRLNQIASLLTVEMLLAPTKVLAPATAVATPLQLAIERGNTSQIPASLYRKAMVRDLPRESLPTTRLAVSPPG